MLPALPIDPLLPGLVATLRETKRIVLEAPPGAGKTTRVPRAMLDAGMAAQGEIVVLQPRRLAARLAAKRVADELREKLGDRVGYQIRFEDISGPTTRIRFVTEGVLTRRLLHERTLPGVSAVVLDEFHERHLHGDVALALLRELQRGERPDLLLVVMSATLDAAPIAEFLGGAPIVSSQGRRFEVAVEYLARPDDRPLAAQIASALSRLVADGLDGDVLVFVPGAAEIHRGIEACAPIASRANLLLLPLHGDLPATDQDRAVRPADRRKVILSTNVAETSVTIDGIVAVIDSGLVRIASHAPWSGLSMLRVARVSRASAAQRAGRAGRTRPGRCVRLYTRHDHDTRPDHEVPEIKRLDLAETVLELRAAGVDDLALFPWFEAPPPGALTAATTLLARLDALDAYGRITADGRRMLRFPVHPRQARMILEAERRGVAADGCTLAALVGERDLRSRTNANPRRHESARSDLLEALDAFDEAEYEGFEPGRLRFIGLEPAAVLTVDRVRKQLVRLADVRASASPNGTNAREAALLQVILAGYPDRVGKRREPETHTGRRGTEIVFAAGGTAQLAETSVVRDAEFVVAIDAEDRVDGRGRQVTVRVASAIEPDWLLEMFTSRVRDETDIRWNAERERIEISRRLSYDALVLEESAAAAPAIDEAAVATRLARAVIERGIHAFAQGDDRDELDRFLARVAFARMHEPSLPAYDAGDQEATVREMCVGLRSFADVRAAGVLGALRRRLSPAQARRLDEVAPDYVTVGTGRRVRVTYPRDGAPWIESRLQDFFGMAEGPRVAGGRVALVLHLNAPNHRAVQVTTDLAGFWLRHYPDIARDLRRKYPRHSWPDDPRNAQPPAQNVGRRR